MSWWNSSVSFDMPDDGQRVVRIGKVGKFESHVLFLACCRRRAETPPRYSPAAARPRKAVRPASAPRRPAAPRPAARCRSGRPTASPSLDPGPAASSAARAAANPSGAAPSSRPVPPAERRSSAARSTNGVEVRQPVPGNDARRQQRQRPAVDRAGDAKAAGRVAVDRQRGPRSRPRWCARRSGRRRCEPRARAVGPPSSRQSRLTPEPEHDGARHPDRRVGADRSRRRSPRRRSRDHRPAEEQQREERDQRRRRPSSPCGSSVSLSARFSTSCSGIFLYLRRFSRTRSKTTTVSLIE